MKKNISKLWIMHTYSHEKEHLKVKIIEHSEVYDFIQEYSVERKENLKFKNLHMTTVIKAALTVLK
jgi:hypothetical protein